MNGIILPSLQKTFQTFVIYLFEEGNIKKCIMKARQQILWRCQAHRIKTKIKKALLSIMGVFSSVFENFKACKPTPTPLR